MFSDFFENIKQRCSCLSEHKKRQNRKSYYSLTRVFRINKGVAAAIAFVFAFTVTGSYAAPQYFNVAIVDGDKSYDFVSTSTTVAELLDVSGVSLSEYDRVTPSPESYITSSQTVHVQRFKNVTVNVSGTTRNYLTTADTVGEFLKQNRIDLNYHDIINLSPETVLDVDNYLEITRIVRRIVKVETEIPFETKTVTDASLKLSESKIVTEGENGVKCETYEVVIKDGVETERNFIGEEVTKEPVDQVKAVGVHTAEKRIEKAQDFSYSKVITCNATAYDLSFQSCGKRPGDPGYGITASGTHAKYGTVAVDPRVIPLGTRMYIESADGSFVYGYCVAEDTGGAIKGNKVDLFFNTYNECMQFGRRNVNVYILD